MKITFYHSNLCPRCRAAGKVLYTLAENQTDIEIIKVDVLRHPIQSWCEGIRFIPTLKNEDRRLSGVFLSKRAIAEFITPPLSI